jgi:hypothetical protein
MLEDREVIMENSREEQRLHQVSRKSITGGRTTVSPELDIVGASVENNRERFVHVTENNGIVPFPNIPGDGSTPIHI